MIVVNGRTLAGSTATAVTRFIDPINSGPKVTSGKNWLNSVKEVLSISCAQIPQAELVAPIRFFT